MRRERAGKHHDRFRCNVMCIEEEVRGERLRVHSTPVFGDRVSLIFIVDVEWAIFCKGTNNTSISN